MTLSYAHEGYEYQDLLTVYFILKEILEENNSEFIIDEKIFEGDKFDDLRIIKGNVIEQKQIKFSNEDISYTLTKDDLSSKGNHNIPLDLLFESWIECKRIFHDKKPEFRLCLSWNKPDEEDKVLQILKNDVKSTKTFRNTHIYRINLEEFWKDGEEPLNSWKRFRKKSEKIDRSKFKEFCDELIIEVNFPKASIDINNPGELENIVIDMMRRIGIGKHPNDNIKVDEAILKVANIVKTARAKNIRIKATEIIKKLKLVTNYGSIKQTIDIEQSINVNYNIKYDKFFEILKKDKKILLFGEPGSGKSWFLENLRNYLNYKGINVIRHYCYIGLNDEYDFERIKTKVFYSNLINNIIECFPNLKSKKPTKYGADQYELEELLKNIKEEVILIIDGLDHIERIYDMNNHILNRDEINIIENILTLKIPENIKVVIATQPIKEKELLNKKGYEVIDIPSWNNEEIVFLMEKFNMSDIEVNKKLLSEILLKKSNGNPLYLTYLLKEIKNMDFITKDKINLIPSYSNNLLDYYNYLIGKLTRDNIVNVLCGMNFYINRKELKEITGEGNFVDESLEILRPILRENMCSGGVMIYHESFRRHRIQDLKSKGVNVKKKIYRDTIEWFEDKGFIEHPKAYRNFLNMLLETEEYNKILTYLDEKFLIDSMFFGYSRELIIRNYRVFLKAATKEKDFPNIAFLSELGNQIDSTKYEVDNIFDLYLEVLGHVHGFDTLKEYLVYEGEPTLNRDKGFRGCYICSENGVIPNWSLYLHEEGENIDIEEFKYVTRGLLDTEDKESINELINNLSGNEYDEFKEIFIEEYIKYYDLDKLKNRIINLKNEKWEKYILNYEKSLKNKILKEYKYISRDIFKIGYITEEKVYILIELFEQVHYFIRIKKLDEINNFIQEISNINWFYNWVIFYIKIKVLEYEKQENNIEDVDNKLIHIYRLLILDTDPFKGEPRTCDLYNVEKLILETIEKSLSWIRKTDTWVEVIEILKIVCNETSTTLQGCLCGPLSTDKFIRILSNNVNQYNIEKVIEIIEYYENNEKNRRYYSYLAEYMLRNSILYAKANKKELAKMKLKEAIRHLLAYTVRADTTFSQLRDSIETLNDLDNSLGNEKIYKLKELADTVLWHTDGKETKGYPIQWYKKFLNINKKEALMYLRKELLQNNPYWILEDSLEELLLSKEEKNLLEKTFLYRTFPNRTSINYLDGYIRNIKLLNKEGYFNIAKISFIDLISRFNIYGYEFRSLDNKIIKDLYLLSKNFKIQIPQLVLLSKSIFKADKGWGYKKVKFNKDIITRKRFSQMNLSEFSSYFEKNTLKKEDINSFIYYIEELNISQEELKQLIKLLISNYTYSMDRKEDLNNLKLGFQNIKLSDDIKSYFYICIYCFEEDGCYNRFYNIEAFKKAYSLNKDVAIEELFNLIYEHLEKPGENNSIASYLINILKEIQYDSKTIIDMWDKVYNLIDYRLPGKVKYDWNSVLDDDYKMNEEELYICVILARLKYSENERQKWVLACINYYLKNNPDVLIKPLKWLFTNKDNLLQFSFLLLLQLLWEYINKNNNKYGLNFTQELKKYYPSDNFMRDIMIEDIIEEYVDVKPKVVINKINYPINEKKIRCLIYFNKILYFLKHIGIDISKICEEFFYEMDNGIGKEMTQLYYNNSKNLIVKNIYQKNTLVSIINKYLSKYMNESCIIGGFVKNEFFYNINFDLKSIIAYKNSISIRPNELILPSNYKDKDILFTDVEEGTEWIRVAYHEKELIIPSYREIDKLGEINIYQGIVFDDNIDWPYNDFESKDIWEYCLYNMSYEYTYKTKIIFNEFYNDDFECNNILWLESSLMTRLGLQTQECNYGLKAKNDKGDDILIFKSWKTDFIGNDEFKNNEIPKLVGEELIIRKDYFQKICEIIKKKPKNLLVRKMQ